MCLRCSVALEVHVDDITPMLLIINLSTNRNSSEK
jgi:hypothetical protein